MQTINKVPVEEEMQRSYIDYAMSVIIGRAIPDVRDGLKPVQRRILYAMYKIGNTHDKQTKKSARIVGETIAKYHPHGDAAVYDSLVRMAQDFSLNCLLVEGQGNMGSIDGDPPAAMRYTEVRLTRIAEEMLEDIEENTVDFIPNFDNTEEEPLVLPAKFPNLLINGASGIAVGVSTSILPHNIIEVCDAIMHRLEHDSCSPSDIMEIIKGPDFPTGGIAIISETTMNGYISGRGRISVRARIEEEGDDLVIKEIPFGLNKSDLISSIASMVKEKKIIGIEDIRDESDKEGIRIVIECERGIDKEQLKNSLYMHTKLECTIPIINLAVEGRLLKTFSILGMIDAFIEHRRNVIRRKCSFELEKNRSELHITEGLIRAIENLNEVIEIIRKSKNHEEAKSQLTERFSLSEEQTKAILEMKLGSLTSLEREEMEKRRDALAQEIRKLENILGSSKEIDNIIISDMKYLKEKYGKPRKTQIIHSDGISEIREEDVIINKDEVIVLSRSGYIKRIGLSEYKEQGRGGKGTIASTLKEGDAISKILICKTKSRIVFITNTGRAYSLKAYNIPERGKYSEGRNIRNLLEMREGENVVCLFAEDDRENVLLLTKSGIVKRMNAKKFEKIRSTGIIAITLGEDEIADAFAYRDAEIVTIVTKKGRFISFNEKDLRVMGRIARGVRGIKLSADDEAVNIIASKKSGYLLVVSEKGYGKLTDFSKYRVQKRGGKGVKTFKVNEKTGMVSKALCVKKEDNVILLSSEGKGIRIPVETIRETGRVASGVRLMKVGPGSKVVDARVAEESSGL
ncbi:MAG: DNA gyrase subunit A [Candidatus Micrarchaeaceae archaeon]